MLQTTAVVLTLRQSRTSVNEDGGRYLSTTAVVMSELFKLGGSLFLLWRERKESLSKTLTYVIEDEFKTNWYGTLLLGVPGLLYTFQNNLIFVALSNLPAALYQVTYQLKILTTAIFSVIMLGRQLPPTQWAALLILFVGVALVQMPSEADASRPPEHGNPFVGLLAILAACCLSGFAGVYFEKILKGTKQSVWLRNIQLSVFGVVLGLGTVIVKDFSAVLDKGFFQYYNFLTWMAIFLQAFGGLVIALVIKYADNILKGFATSLSIILTGVVSLLFLDDFSLSPYFMLGTLLVMAATILYSMPAKTPSKPAVLPTSK